MAERFFIFMQQGKTQNKLLDFKMEGVWSVAPVFKITSTWAFDS